MRRLIVVVVILLIVLGAISMFQKYSPTLTKSLQSSLPAQNVKVVSEESVTIDAVKKVGPSVVTIAEKAASGQQSFNAGPFFIFGGQDQGQTPDEPQSIGSGFMVSSDG